MTLFSILPQVFTWAAAALALVSVRMIVSAAPGQAWHGALRIAASIMTLLAIVLIFQLMLLAVYAVLSPFGHILLLIPFRGQYAWKYWLYFMALLAAQLLWVPSLRRKPVGTFVIGLSCFLLASANRIALFLWASD